MEEKKSCGCCGEHDCGDDCTCTHENRYCDSCSCEEECNCGEECKCGGDCHCGEECQCDENCECEDCNQADGSYMAKQYLDMAQRIQAEFDNYRRRSSADIANARVQGQVSVIETFLPCLDTFKEAKKHITDESVLSGVEMIENKILEALNSLGVEKIDAVGQKYDPHLHNAIAVMRDEGQENDIILDEYQAGYKFNDKVIRYSKVIVNKKED